MHAVSQQEWRTLSEEERVIAFNEAKRASGCYVKNDIEFIVRPLLPMLGYWSAFKHLVQAKCPKGEEQEFHEKAPTYENYKQLINWLHAKCFPCGSSDVYWEKDDKSIITYCYKCGNERFFLQGN